MKQFKVTIVSGNVIVFRDIIKAHDSGHAIGRLSGILSSYDNLKVECNIVEDGKNNG
jgi:hypothetical protein